MLSRILSFSFVFLLLHVLVFSQKLTETQWFFGADSLNIQFDKNGREAHLEFRKNLNFGSSGSAVISANTTGNLHFYSDGVRVYDASHRLVSGFSPLNGNDTLNVPVVASPLPGNPDEFFLFTNSGEAGVNEIQFSRLRRDLPGNGTFQAPLGEMTVANQSTGLTDPAEGMLIVPHGQNNNRFWLISQDRITFDFRVSEISPLGISSTQSFNFVNSLNPGFEASRMRLNEDSLWLAVAPRTANRNVMILQFNDTLGTLAFRETLLNTSFNSSPGHNVWDLAWSPNGTKLYLSNYGQNNMQVANIFQVNMSDTTRQISPVLANPIYRSYGLRIGIDNRLYYLHQDTDTDSIRIGLFENLDSLVSLINYNPDLFGISFNSRQFPEFSAGIFSGFTQFTFSHLDSCEQQTTKFFPQISPTPNQVFWDFGDGNTSNNWAPSHGYEGPGIYNVQLFAELNGEIQNVSIPIQILSNTLEIDLGADTVICVDESLTLDAGSEGVTYVWNTGENTSTISIDTTGTYWVAVGNGTGCVSYDAIEVTEYGVQIQTGNLWYFGDQAGIDFRQPSPVGLADANQMSSLEGCATISDVNGQLLFYTNGKTVWNRDHLEMPGGTNLSGDSTTTQGITIMPFADDETMFYIFYSSEISTSGSKNLFYAIVDMKEASLGAVVAKDLILFENASEKITSTGFGDGQWLLTHELGNNNFRANQISASGISSTVHSPEGSFQTFQDPIKAAGTMKLDPTNSLMVQSIPGENELEFLRFSFPEGTFDYRFSIPVEEIDDAYGLEFSGGGGKLYMTTSSRLAQYDLDSLDTPDEELHIRNSKFTGYAVSGQLGTLQRASNGIIYLAIEGSPTVGAINNPANDDLAADYRQIGVDLLGRTSRLGLPNFVFNSSTNSQPPSLSVENTCFGQETLFSGQGTSIIDEYYWTFDNGLQNFAGFDSDTSVLFDLAGLHIVQLDIRNRCVPLDSFFATFIDTVDIFLVPESPLVPDDANLCNGPISLSAWFEDRTDLSYIWSTGDTTRTITVNSPGSINVSIVNSDGCASAQRNTFVGDSRPFLDLGSDRFFCQNDLLASLDANTSGVVYQWFIEGELADTSRIQSVETTSIGSFTYSVTITEPFFDCTSTDTLLVQILEQPQVNAQISSPSDCGLADGSVQLSINSSGFFSYSFENDVILDEGSLDGPSDLPIITNLSGGNYRALVTNLLTGCIADQPVFVEDQVGYDLFADNLPSCIADLNLQLTITGLTLPQVLDVYILDSFTDTVFQQASVPVPFRIAPTLDSGLYFVNVYDVVTGCFQADSVLIDPTVPQGTECEPVIVAPNAFSPNGNGLNDEFFVLPNAFVGNFEIFIYSRWGELIYYSDTIDFRWDGKFRNADLMPGTYAYILKFTNREDPTGRIINQHGVVTILR